MRLGSRFLLRSGIWSMGQTVLSAVIYMLLYGFLFRSLGPEGMGLWALVLGLGAVVRLADAGILAMLRRFVAVAFHAGDTAAARRIVATSGSVLLAISGTLAVLVWWLSDLWAAGYLGDPGERSRFTTALAIHLAGTMLFVLYGALAAGLDAAGRIGLRAAVSSAGVTLQLALAVAFVPGWGVSGAAVAHAGMSALMALGCGAGLLTTLRIRAGSRREPLPWREMADYAARYFFVSVGSNLLEPTVRLLVVHFGGLAAAGIYEMASKLVLQVRSVVSAALYPLVVSAAGTAGRGASMPAAADRAGLAMNDYGQILLAALLVPIGTAWLGRNELAFFEIAAALVLGWWANTTGATAFFWLTGRGELNTIVLAVFVIFACLATLGVGLGTLVGALGVVTALALGLAGSGLLMRARVLGWRAARLAVMSRAGALLAATLICSAVAGSWVVAAHPDGFASGGIEWLPLAFALFGSLFFEARRIRALAGEFLAGLPAPASVARRSVAEGGRSMRCGRSPTGCR